MTAAARLAGFAAALAITFTIAVLVGGAVDPNTSVGKTTAKAKNAHGGAMAGPDKMAADEGEHAMTAQKVRGLSVADGGYTLELADRELPVHTATHLRFRILTKTGAPLKRYTVEHERRMHLIVVRRDTSGFQHLHPKLRPDGTWSADIRFSRAGAYRVFADFKTGDTPRTLGADLAVDGPAAYRALPESEPLADAGDGYQVRLDNDPVRAGKPAALRFTVHKDGRAVHTEPYLGAGGHLVALRDGDLAFLHVHPVAHDETAASENTIPFETTYPTAGRYRLFLQFKHNGQVRTAAFTQEVAR